jgi:hypothetical protein
MSSFLMVFFIHVIRCKAIQYGAKDHALAGLNFKMMVLSTCMC